MNDTTSPAIAVIIVAAGRGRRLGGAIPKQYVPLDGPPALRRSVEVFLAVPGVVHVQSVIHADDCVLCGEALAGLDDARVMPPVTGGETRAASVLSGLEALAPHAPDRVLIHDAARPFVPRTVVEAVISALDAADGAVAGLPVVDALWREQGGMADAPVPRNGLWRAQTPQGFRFDAILAAHRAHDGTGADDVAVAREAGIAVKLVEGSEQSFKITTQADLDRALAHVRRTV